MSPCRLVARPRSLSCRAVSRPAAKLTQSDIVPSFLRLSQFARRLARPNTSEGLITVVTIAFRLEASATLLYSPVRQSLILVA